MTEKKVYECDHCGTMLEEGDDYVTVLAKLKGADLLFTNLRFCCPDCANRFAEEHAEGGVVGVMPVMADINVIPNTDNHDFIKWNYIKGKQFAAEHNPDAVDRQSWDSEEDYSNNPDQESCTWGNYYGWDGAAPEYECDDWEDDDGDCDKGEAVDDWYSWCGGDTDAEKESYGDDDDDWEEEESD